MQYLKTVHGWIMLITGVLAMLLSGCASTDTAYEWREQPDGSYFHCVVDGPCDERFTARRATDNWV